MKPGRELDARVAEKVIGLSLMHLPDARDPNSGVMVSALSDGDVYYWDGAEREWSPILAYSTDIAAAWEVVDAIRSKHGGGLLELYRNGDETWAARFDDGERVSTGDTAPHAICLAAIAALEVG